MFWNLLTTYICNQFGANGIFVLKNAKGSSRRKYRICALIVHRVVRLVRE